MAYWVIKSKMGCYLKDPDLSEHAFSDFTEDRGERLELYSKGLTRLICKLYEQVFPFSEPKLVRVREKDTPGWLRSADKRPPCGF